MNETKQFTVADYIIWRVVFIWLIVDSITGFFSSKGLTLPLSQLVKLGLLAIIVIRLSSTRWSLYIYCLTIIYIAFYYTHLAIHSYPFSNSLLILSKFLSIVILYSYFKFSFQTFPSHSFQLGKKTIIISGIVVFVNVFLGLMGYGVTSYGSEELDMGVKGYFYAGNELGGIMVVLAPFLYYLSYTQLRGIIRIIAYILITATGIVIGTKTCILVTLISAFFVPYVYSDSNTKKKVIVLIIVLIATISYYSMKIIEESDIGAIDRWQYNYDKGGLARLIFSGRDLFWDEQKVNFFNSSFLSQLFGLGSDGKIIERDHLDSLVIYGYFGFVLICTFFIYLLYNAIYLRKNNSLTKFIILSDVLIIFIGYFAGHVWFSGMASVFIALINAFVFIKHKDILFSNNSQDYSLKN